MYTEHVDILQNTDCCSVAGLCPTLCDPVDWSMPGFPVLHHLLISRSLLKLMSIWWCHPTISFSVVAFLPSIFPIIWVFPNEPALCIKWPKYRSFSFSICPPNEYSGLIFFRIDWLDLLAVQGTLKSLLQHHGSKASILWHSAFFTVQLSHLCVTTGEKP